jgi:hypothetical protein
MNAEEKRKFINDLCDSLKKRILDKVEFMPEEWDGLELRLYIKDVTKDQAVCGDIGRTRKMAYHNEVLTRNL